MALAAEPRSRGTLNTLRRSRMDQARAQELLAEERSRLQRLLAAESQEQDDELSDDPDLGDEVDNADRRDAEETSRAVDELLRDRWAALQRAEARLVVGSYGQSVRSGQPIPDERLEGDRKSVG